MAEQNPGNLNRSIVNAVQVVLIIVIPLVTALIVVLIAGGLSTKRASFVNGVIALVKKTVNMEIPTDQMTEDSSDFAPISCPLITITTRYLCS